MAEQIYRQLAMAIAAGAHAPSDRINIRRLAEEIGASVTPVRDAVLRLVADGVLDVTERSAIIVPERSEAEIEETFDIRRGLEAHLAFVAAPKLTDDDIAALKDIQAQFLEALQSQDYRKVLQFNSNFHFLIYRRANLPLRLKIVETLWLRIGPSLRYMYPTLRRSRKNHRRHEDIINAATRRHPEELRDAIVADLESSQAALRTYAQQQASDRALRAAGSR